MRNWKLKKRGGDTNELASILKWGIESYLCYPLCFCKPSYPKMRNWKTTIVWCQRSEAYRILKWGIESKFGITWTHTPVPCGILKWGIESCSRNALQEGAWGYPKMRNWKSLPVGGKGVDWPPYPKMRNWKQCSGHSEYCEYISILKWGIEREGLQKHSR